MASRRPPVAIDNTLTFLQNAAAPTALFVLGVTVALRPFDRVPWEVPGVIAVKLMIHPLIAFGLMLLFGPFAVLIGTFASVVTLTSVMWLIQSGRLGLP
jgi:predicted permease